MRTSKMIFPDHTTLGNRVKEELLAISAKDSRLQIINYVIMPDHIHFVLQVLSQLEKPIGKYIAPFSMACSRAYTEHFELCKEGRLLCLCPWPDNSSRRSKAVSDEFHQMNDFATIATLPASDRLAIRIEKDS